MNATQILEMSATDLIGRLGGDEFAVVLSNTDKAQAIEAVDKLKSALHTAMTDRGWLVTFSVGLGIFKNVPASEDEMISFTDKLMYRVKSSGKNDILADEYTGGGAVSELTAWRNTGS